MADSPSTTCLSAPLFVQVPWLLSEAKQGPWLAERGIPLEAIRNPWLHLDASVVQRALSDLDGYAQNTAAALDVGFWGDGLAAQDSHLHRLWAPILRKAPSLAEAWHAVHALHLLPAGLTVERHSSHQAHIELARRDAWSAFCIALLARLPHVYGYDVSTDATGTVLRWSARPWFARLGPLRGLLAKWEDRIAARRALAIRAQIFEAAVSDLGEHRTRVIGDKFQVVGTLGAGATAVVHDAITSDTGTRVAVKELRVASRDDGVLADRLRREGDALSLSASPHIVKLLGRGDTPQGKPYLVLEYLDGQTLRTRVAESGPLRALELHRLAEALLSAARVMHSAGVVHRDLSPSNIVLSNCAAMHATVVDFGTAQIEWEETRITQPGVTIGTAGFLAPEMSQGAKANALTDLYSLGASLHYAGTGEAPAFGAFDRLRPMDAWDVFFKGLLSTDPSKRFASATDALAALPPAPTPSAAPSALNDGQALVAE